MKTVRMAVKFEVDSDISLDMLNAVAENVVDTLDKALGRSLHGVYPVKFTFESTDPLPNAKE